jgi:DNA-binding transcriptional regulator YbjK
MTLSTGEIKRRQIMDAALELIGEKGVDAVTHRSVGAQAGVSHGVVSYHFPTRGSIIYKAFEYYLGSIEDYKDKDGWLRHEAMSTTQIAEYLTAVVSEELASSTLILVEQELLLVAARNPDLAMIHRDWEKKLLESFAAGLQRSNYKEPQNFAKAILNFTRGFLLEKLTEPSLTEQDFKERVLLLLHSNRSND